MTGKSFRTRQLNQKGFTLVELLVVIAIIAILAAVVAPNAFKAIDNAKASAVIRDIDAIKTAAFIFYADTGEFPNGAVSGPEPYEEWNADSRSIFITGGHPNQPAGWDGPYLDHWPDSTPFGGCYAYRYLHSEDGGALGWATGDGDVRNIITGELIPNENTEVIYIRFNNDADHVQKRNKTIEYLRRNIDPALIYTSGQTGHNEGLIVIKIKR